ncbi:MAG: hypothetical protein EOM87_07380 [Clostridia bacterium]|nr:hypothetical protein [Clostridia bacterium]
MKKIITILLALTLLCSLFVFFTACNDTDDDKVVFDNITIKADGELKILQLTDIHLTASEYETVADLRAAGINLGPVSNITAWQRDRWALRTVGELIEEAQPDLIIVTGDLVYVNPFTQFLTPIGHTDNLKAIKLFAEYIETFCIPWAVTLGNHDHEGDYTREQIADYLCTLEYCIFQKGPDDITGFGNYIINVLNSDGTYNTALIMMDSNSYINADDHTGSSGYDRIHENQIQWYEESLNNIKSKYSLNVLPASLLFIHIPVTEYNTAKLIYFEEIRSGIDNPDFTFHEGVFGENNAATCTPFVGTYNGNYYDGGKIFDKIVELGSTKGIFVGHDHANNLIMEYMGVQLVYSKSIDYIAYPAPDICKNDNFRGGTEIILKDKQAFVYNSDTQTIKLINYTGGLYAAYKAGN